MKETLAIAALALSTGLGLVAVTTRRPSRMVLAGLLVGVVQSGFFVVAGFELLAVWNLLFSAASATALQLFSALCGSEAIRAADSDRRRSDWILGAGAALTLGAIAAFGVSELAPARLRESDVPLAEFSRKLTGDFPALPFVLGLVLFLAIVAWSTIGRPGWKRPESEDSR